MIALQIIPFGRACAEGDEPALHPLRPEWLESYSVIFAQSSPTNANVKFSSFFKNCNPVKVTAGIHFVQIAHTKNLQCKILHVFDDPFSKRSDTVYTRKS